MNEKIIIRFIIFLFLFLLAACCSGCRTQPVVVDTNEAIAGSMDSFRQLRIINERTNSILADYDSFITRTSESLRAGAIDFRKAFTDYDEFVSDLVYRIEELERISRGLDE